MMNNKKVYVITTFIIILFLFVNTTVLANENITDLTGDIYHHYLDEDTNEYKWKMAEDNIPNIDILELSFTIVDNTANFKIKVNGEIENSPYISYLISYTSTYIDYNAKYSNGQIIGNAKNTRTSIQDNDPQFNISNDTLTITFESMDQELNEIEFYSYALYSVEGDLEDGETWSDFAPGTYFPGEIIEEDVVEEDNDDNAKNQTDSNEESIDDTSSNTPGFEILSLTIAIISIFYILRRKKHP